MYSDFPIFLNLQRGRSNSNTDAEIIKIKRNETPDDIFSALLKEQGLDKDSDGDADSDDVDETEKDDVDRDDYTKNKDDRKRSISCGCHLVEGKMRHGMEDYLVAKHKTINGHKLGLYAIFDGHSGREVAEYLQNHLFENILNEPDFWTSPKAAVRKAYEATNKDILENVVGSRGGSTAVTAILIDKVDLIVANVGDSRGVICKSGTAKQITVDHEPMKEKKLVESKGGFVSKKRGNVPRVDGQLAMTRAFGDERLKDHITAEPYIAIKKIDEDTEFVILASDGLWKVMSNQEAVDCIRESRDGQEAAEELIKEALLREGKDDISCGVVMFH
ncbi:PREDICTED: probable protein phosphatase 2C 58 isoform X1 [Erythranthe guttata]|uniref:probable protein phosphatase 2C 58 isoform X1 n=1 Tax=Erythranthe guttata TaxID=4155 RepID=UPI00064E11BB|nr:PREDICTED: probable protein phosphatase 2C 58 isoform X1 [Erythranthe guttata]|eukprot:XP_012830188.1 PREDICTED: probable protein phosphatase 2C 58 isoform X1 [Erythranthe guttata]